jgi:hypothetical protein
MLHTIGGDAMDREVGWQVDLHAVRRVLEVRAQAANELLEAGWILHDIYFSSEGDYHSTYILLSTEEPTCAACGSAAKIEVVGNGERIRYVCSRECPSMALENTSTPV